MSNPYNFMRNLRQLLGGINTLLFLSCTLFANGQSFRVNLPNRTALDDPSGGHMTLFSKTPDYQLILPPLDTTCAHFFKIFYSHNVKGDPEIWTMVIQDDSTDILYIDRNDDRDLTNDGPPLLFSVKCNECIFSIVANQDTNQQARILLQRKPNLPDSILTQMFDKRGYIYPQRAKWMSKMFEGDSDFQGAPRTYYFDDRLNLSRGKIIIEEISYEVGLVDENNNGLFNDTGKSYSQYDLFMIDLNRDGKLDSFHNNETFWLDDIIQIGDDTYEIKNVDRYGRYLELVKSTKPATFYYLNEIQAAYQKTGTVLDTAFWHLTLETLDNKKFKTEIFRGKFVLLNFWGEWCGPCRAEIDELVYIRQKYSTNTLDIVSFLNTANLQAAEKIISTKKMVWYHTLLTDKLEHDFNIRSYPTNILILPDGKIVSTGQVNRSFIDQYVR